MFRVLRIPPFLRILARAFFPRPGSSCQFYDSSCSLIDHEASPTSPSFRQPPPSRIARQATEERAPKSTRNFAAIFPALARWKSVQRDNSKLLRVNPGRLAHNLHLLALPVPAQPAPGTYDVRLLSSRRISTYSVYLPPEKSRSFLDTSFSFLFPWNKGSTIGPYLKCTYRSRSAAIAQSVSRSRVCFQFITPFEWQILIEGIVRLPAYSGLNRAPEIARSSGARGQPYLPTSYAAYRLHSSNCHDSSASSRGAILEFPWKRLSNSRENVCKPMPRVRAISDEGRRERVLYGKWRKGRGRVTRVASIRTSLVPVATSVNRVYIPDRPINWLTEPRTRLALCNRGAPSFSFQGVQERQPTDQAGRQANQQQSKARQQGRPFPTFYHLRLRKGHTANIIIRVQPPRPSEIPDLRVIFSPSSTDR